MASKSQRAAKAANIWNEQTRSKVGGDVGGHATKSLRKSMRDVRSDNSVGGALSRIKENPVTALKRRAARKTPTYKKGGMVKGK